MLINMLVLGILLIDPATTDVKVNSDLIAVTLISGIVAIAVAWIGRPAQRRLARIEEHASKTGNGWTSYLDSRLDRLEVSLEAKMDITTERTNQHVKELGVAVARLEGRFNEHVRRDRRHDSPTQ